MANLNRMLELLDEVNITNVVGMRHDVAREQYVVTKRTVNSFPEFLEEVTRFTQFQLGAALNNATPQYIASSQAMDIIERAFASIGGIQGAYQIASTGIRGGLRNIINVLYEEIKKEEQEKYIKNVLVTYVDPCDFNDRVVLMEAYLNRFRSNFPQGVRVPSALEMAGHYESVIMLHMEVINSIRMRIRRG